VAKILFLVTEDYFFVSHRLPIAKAVQKAGFKVTVVTRVSNKRELLESYGIKVVHIDIDRSGMNPITEALTVWKITQILKKERPDILHLVSLKPVILGGLAAKILGIHRKVLAITGLGFLFVKEDRKNGIRKIVTKLLVNISKTGHVIVQNREDASLLTKAGVNSKQITLIKGSGVDINVFKFSPEPKGKVVIMLASRLLWDKGVGEFVEAARILKSKNIEARFVLVGGPDLGNPKSISEQDLKCWVSEGIIEWWGKKDDMHNILPKSNIFCLPSYYREGLPKALLEAMACGRPCVTTDAPGCRDAVRDGVNGFLVKTRDSQGLALALERLILDPELRRRMGQKGRQIAEAEFSIDNVVKQTMDVYKKLFRSN